MLQILYPILKLCYSNSKEEYEVFKIFDLNPHIIICYHYIININQYYSILYIYLHNSFNSTDIYTHTRTYIMYTQIFFEAPWLELIAPQKLKLLEKYFSSNVLKLMGKYGFFIGKLKKKNTYYTKGQMKMNFLGPMVLATFRLLEYMIIIKYIKLFIFMTIIKYIKLHYRLDNFVS